MIEKTLILIKPDGVKRGFIGEVISRFEKTGLIISGMKMLWISKEFAGKHYTYEDIAIKHGEEVRNRLIDFITESPIVAMVINGVEAITICRKICGKTEPKEALLGTIRGDFAHHSYEYCGNIKMTVKNIVHASANKEDAKREIDLWFNDKDIFNYNRNDSFEHFGKK